MNPMLLAAFAYIGFQLKSVPVEAWKKIKEKLIYSTHIRQGDQLFEIIEEWISENYDRTILSSAASFQFRKLKLSHHDSTFFIKFKGKWLCIRKSYNNLQNASSLDNAYYSDYSISGLKAKDKVIDLIDTAINVYNDKRMNMRNIYVNDKFGNWMLVGELKSYKLESIWYRHKNSIITDIMNFQSNESEFIRRGIPYKRGYMFYGPPGNGKTSMALGICHRLKRDAMIVNLNDMDSDESIITAFIRTSENQILILEDVDAAFSNRKGDKGISFSALLNCLDGAYSKHGMITIMTTNHLDKIDPALFRPGRCDQKFLFDNPDGGLIKHYIENFFNDKINVEYFPEDQSMATVQEVCLVSNSAGEAAERLLVSNKIMN